MAAILRSIWEFIGNNWEAIVATCALFFTAYEVYATRRHNRLSVRPHLTRFVHKEISPNGARLVLQLLNNGLGPARIRKFQVSLNGKPIKSLRSGEAQIYIETLLADRIQARGDSHLADDYMMLAGESKDILWATFSIKPGDSLDVIEEKLSQFDVRVNYESIYGERFSLDTREDELRSDRHVPNHEGKLCKESG